MMAVNPVGWGMISVKFYFQNIPGHRALDEDRPGQRMHSAGMERGKVGNRGTRGDLAVDPIARFQRDLLALVDFHQRGDVRMVAVVATARVVAKPLGSIDANGAHGRCLSDEVSHGYKSADRVIDPPVMDGLACSHI
jgi:hypothetical protein